MTGRQPTVLLCCAAEDRFALAPAVERLLRESLVVDFISGVDFDPGRLEEAIGRHRTQALYVLVRSERLDRFKLTRLQLLLKREGLLESNVVPVQLLAERAESVSNPVLEWLRQGPDPSRSQAPGPPAPPASAEKVASRGTDADRDDDASTLPVRLQDILESPERGAPAAAVPPRAPPAPAPAPAARAPAPAPAPATARPPATPPATPPPAPPAAPPAARPQSPAPAAPPAAPPQSPAPVARPPTPPARELAEDELDFDAALGRRSRAPWLAAGIAGALLVGIVGIFALSGDEPDESKAPAPASEQAAREPAAPEPAPSEPAPPEPAPPEPATPEPEPEPEPDPAPSEPDPVPAPAVPPPAPAPDTFALTPAQEHAAMMEALRTRRIRAVDLVVFVPAVSRYGDLARAQTYCAQMDIDGLRGWRLGTPGELRMLLDTDVISAARYWTSKSARGGKQLLFEGRSKSASPKKPSYKGGRALCIRDDAATGR